MAKGDDAQSNHGGEHLQTRVDTIQETPQTRKVRCACVLHRPLIKSRGNDFKASRFWGKIGNELHLINCWVRQDSVNAMVRWLYDLYESLPEGVAVQFLMEANFMQDILLDEFVAEGEERGYQLPDHG